MKAIFFLLALFNLARMPYLRGQETRWTINPSGGISWLIKPGEAHRDNIEMSGKFISAVVYYGVDTSQGFFISRDIVWPMLRTIPNNTHASLIRTFGDDVIRSVSVNGKTVAEKVKDIRLDGKITVESTLIEGLNLVRTLFPSTDKPVFFEKYLLSNTGTEDVYVEVPALTSVITTPADKGVEGSYELVTTTYNAGNFLVKAGEELSFYLSVQAEIKGARRISVDVEDELRKRQNLVAAFWDNLVLETPDSILNRMFAFAKIRAAESIYQTKGGPMHGPGGLSYYAAIWANDQAEYINPFFPYLGYDYGIQSAVNAYRHFARFMNPGYQPIPSSIIAEGLDIWNGAGDRGDAAMIAYGAARFALSQGDRQIAEKLWPLITWCLEYNRRQLNPAGVVASKTDELEGRFPAGNANLNTSSLYYDALISAGYLGRSLGKDKGQLSAYQKQSVALRNNIEKYFGATVMGFNTYRYYQGNDVLRAWICTPLVMNIFDRKQGTIDALFSPQLWTRDGLATQSGDKVFWDRATLYGLRGVLAAGERERGIKYLEDYSARRLLGEHVPYPVEAYPEGNQRHLSAESGLYCRIYTEGLFGIRPTGLHSFTITPQLPDEWEFMRLKKVHGFQHVFDVEARREGKMTRVVITEGERTVLNTLIKPGTSHTVEL